MTDRKLMQEIDDIALDLFRLSQRVERLNMTIHGEAWVRELQRKEKAAAEASAEFWKGETPL